MTTATTAQPARPSPAPAGSAPSGSAPAEYTHREILTALSGLLLAMLVAILSSTIVSNALPTIISDLHGSQTGYTWVVTATLLTTTVTTPIWGKLADLLNKKLLVQVAITIFILGSVGAGLSGSIESLIGWRAVQGIGAGGLQALAQVVIAVLIPPRQRVGHDRAGQDRDEHAEQEAGQGLQDLPVDHGRRCGGLLRKRRLGDAGHRAKPLVVVLVRRRAGHRTQGS